MNNPKRINILDIPVDLVDMAGGLAFLEQHIRSAGNPGYVLAVNPEKVMVLREDPALLEFFRKALLLIPDGIGVVWAAKKLGSSQDVDRVAGADLMQELCSLSAGSGFKIYIYGSKEEVNAGASEILVKRYPGLQVVGRSNGYVPVENNAELVDNINSAGADILFVALGSPKQEQWIAENVNTLNVKIVQGIGGTLDTITGHVKRAPLIMQKLNLEWFYRLITNPRRLRRQMILPVFVFKVILAKFGCKTNKT